MRGQRLPAAPLVQLLEVVHQEHTHDEIAERLGYASMQSFRRWFERMKSNDRGVLRCYADRYAVRLGKHPSEIWIDW